nr:MAG TPA: hypothetical protein [Caudoviricetes sp.]
MQRAILNPLWSLSSIGVISYKVLIKRLRPS